MRKFLFLLFLLAGAMPAQAEDVDCGELDMKITSDSGITLCSVKEESEGSARFEYQIAKHADGQIYAIVYYARSTHNGSFEASLSTIAKSLLDSDSPALHDQGSHGDFVYIKADREQSGETDRCAVFKRETMRHSQGGARRLLMGMVCEDEASDDIADETVGQFLDRIETPS